MASTPVNMDRAMRLNNAATRHLVHLNARFSPLDARVKPYMVKINDRTRRFQTSMRKADVVCKPLVKSIDSACQYAARKTASGIVVASKSVGRAALCGYYRAAKKMEKRRRASLEASFGRESYAAAVEGKWDDVAARAAATKAQVDDIDSKIESLDKKIEVLSNGPSYALRAGRSREADMAAAMSSTVTPADPFPAVNVPMVTAAEVKDALERSDAAKQKVSEILGRSWGPDRRGRYPSLDSLVSDFMDGPGAMMSRERFEQILARTRRGTNGNGSDDEWVAVAAVAEEPTKEEVKI